MGLVLISVVVVTQFTTASFMTGKRMQLLEAYQLLVEQMSSTILPSGIVVELE
jgi:hypothetical protein